MLGAPILILSLRWIPPAVAILGQAPLYLGKWTIIRLVSLPFPRSVYRRLDQILYGSYQAMVGFYYELWSGVEFCFYGDKIPSEPENALYISNHQCTFDWVIPELLCVKQGGGGRVRYILKDALRFLPLYGWYLGHRGGIFVRRGEKDHKALIEGLQGYAKEKLPVWLCIFPEGTRYSPLRVVKSKQYAHSLGIPELKHVLTPKTTGFELALEHAGTHFDAVYDITIFYEGVGGDRGRCGRAPPPDLFNFFCGVCSKVHIHIRRIPMDEFPKEAEDRRAWLYDAYQRKDKLLMEWMTQQHCSSPVISHPLTLGQSFPQALFLAVTLSVALATRRGRITMLSLLGFYTAVTFISALLSKS